MDVGMSECLFNDWVVVLPKAALKLWRGDSSSHLPNQVRAAVIGFHQRSFYVILITKVSRFAGR